MSAITILTDQVFVNDIGTVFRATIKEDEVVVEVSVHSRAMPQVCYQE